MITIKAIGENYVLTCDINERITINNLQARYPRKLERHIEEYLKERKVNIREQENMLIMSTMSDEERAKRLREIETESSKKEQNA